MNEEINLINDLHMTKRAVDKLQAAIDAEQTKPFAIRIGVRGGGCQGYQYLLDFIKNEADVDPDEDTIKQLGELKIVIDIFSAQYLDGTTIDYLDTLSESGFKFNNPNKRTCGCGSSFST